MFRFLVALWLPVLVAPPPGSTAFPSSDPAPEPGDEAIREAMHRGLRSDEAVSESRLEVGVSRGIVTIEGTVESLLEKERAASIATTVEGVRAVVNLVTVTPSEPPDDDAVKRRIRRALLEDPATDAWEIGVSVEDGRVLLAGVIESWSERDLAALVAKSVRGVTALQNEIRVEPREERPDREIRLEIESALRWDLLVDEELVEVSVEDGHVELTGSVESLAEQHRALRDAWTAGVRTVDVSELRVVHGTRHEARETGKDVIRSDAEIRSAVQEAFRRDPDLDASDVNVAVRAGFVTLSGEVPTHEQRRVAARRARDTIGVRSVTNDLVPAPDRSDPGAAVKPLPRIRAIEPDARVRRRIELLLRWNPFVNSREIAVIVENGIATLMGSVGNLRERHAAAVAAREAGATYVENRLEVRSNADSGPTPHPTGGGS